MMTMFRNKVKTLSLVNEVIKLKVFDDFISFVDFTKQVYQRDDIFKNNLCECEVEAVSKRILCQKPILYTFRKLGGVHG